jgi:hypothetical protein
MAIGGAACLVAGAGLVEEILYTPHLTGSGRLLMARKRLMLLRCEGHVVRRGWLRSRSTRWCWTTRSIQLYERGHTPPDDVRKAEPCAMMVERSGDASWRRCGKRRG